jgi:GTPase SAR1 family protein
MIAHNKEEKMRLHIFGEAGVGKTSLINAMRSHRPDLEYVHSWAPPEEGDVSKSVYLARVDAPEVAEPPPSDFLVWVGFRDTEAEARKAWEDRACSVLSYFFPKETD